MLKFLRALIPRPTPSASDAPVEAHSTPPHRVHAPEAAPFEFAAALDTRSGFPVPDWIAVQRWVADMPGAAAQADAWSACESAWLAHFRAALGPGFVLRSQGSALLLSSLPKTVADATLGFVNQTVRRILHMLDGVATRPVWGQELLIVFDDDETYYGYVSNYYPEAGEFAASSGMYIHAGCGHFVTLKGDLRALEPVIAHELTHACLGHLPLPAWLNEGLAVNTELQLCPPAQAGADPRELHARHLAFWGPQEIQQFWSGKSFLRPDEGNELSYDLARLLVAQFARDWARFRPFALAADLSDGGAAAASAQLGIELGAAVCAVLEREPEAEWAPRPQAWVGEAERGAF